MIPAQLSATKLHGRIQQLEGIRIATLRRRNDLQKQSSKIANYLAIAPAVESRLQNLSDQLFGQLVAALEQNITVALQEVLEQPLEFKAERSIKRGTLCLEFYVEREGQREDIIHGQGGSVANVISVGLRFFALATLDESDHRRFLVLDEQDCWLRPDLVPRLVKIIYDAGHSLGFQVLLISHHDVSAFTSFADCVYQLVPTPEGVEARKWEPEPLQADGDVALSVQIGQSTTDIITF